MGHVLGKFIAEFVLFIQRVFRGVRSSMQRMLQGCFVMVASYTKSIQTANKLNYFCRIGTYKYMKYPYSKLIGHPYNISKYAHLYLPNHPQI